MGQKQVGVNHPLERLLPFWAQKAVIEDIVPKGDSPA